METPKDWNERMNAIEAVMQRIDSAPRACNCIGPQNGQPRCPCAMRNVKVVNGRYVEVNDLGPALPLAKVFPAGGPLIGG